MEATPTDTSRSSGVSIPISQQPAAIVAVKYPPGTDPNNPPFMRPTSSLDTSSRLWTDPSQPFTDQSIPRQHHIPSISNINEQPPINYPPSTPERPSDAPPTSPNHPITPTQQGVAPAPRLLAREVDSDTLSRLRSNTTGSEPAGISFRDEVSDEVEETREIEADHDEEDDGVRVEVLLPALTPAPSKGKAKAKEKAPPATRPVSAKRSSNRKQSRHDAMSHNRGRNNEDDHVSPSPTPAQQVSVVLPPVRAPPRRSSPPISPSHVSKAVAMKRKLPMSPAKPDVADSSQDIPLASLPNVEKGRGRKSSIRTKIKAKAQRPVTPESEQDTQEESDKDELMDVDEDTTVEQDEAEVSDAIPVATTSQEHVVSEESDDDVSDEEEAAETDGTQSDDHRNDQIGIDDDSSSSPDDSNDETYQYEESQVPGPGHVDGFGIKRKRGSYKAVSPAKASRKRARDRQATESPRKRRRVSKGEESTPAPRDSPRPDVLRVFARWSDKQFYLGRVTTRTKKDEYAVLFDDGAILNVPLSKLRSEVVEGDRVKIMANPVCQARWAIVTGMEWRGDEGQFITATLEKAGTSVTVRSQYVVLPKDTFAPERRLTADDVSNIDKAIRSPRRMRSKDEQTTKIIPQRPDTKGKMKAERKPRAPSKPTSADPQRKSLGRTSSKLQPELSVLSFADSEGTVTVSRLPPTQLKHSFAKTIVLMTNIDNKASLSPRIRRAGGKIVEEWTDILTFGEGRANVAWKGVAKESGVEQILLLAKEASYSTKFMMALALGVPCISIQWALDRLDGVSFLLPSPPS